MKNLNFFICLNLLHFLKSCEKPQGAIQKLRNAPVEFWQGHRISIPWTISFKKSCNKGERTSNIALRIFQ